MQGAICEEKKMDNKIKVYISSLSDEEIEEQLSDIFDWVKEYQSALKAEQLDRIVRKREMTYSNFSSATSNSSISCEFENGLNADYSPTDETLDYLTATAIQNKVIEFSLEKTQESLERLKGISEFTLSFKEKAQLRFEIETCELHLSELIHKGSLSDSQTCPICGNRITEDDAFCAVCGSRLQRKG